MSFENKGFPNDLNSRYEALNRNHEYYDKPMNLPLGNPKMTTYGVPQNVVMPSYLQTGTSGKPAETPKKSVIGTAENPTEMEPVVIVAPRKKKPMAYILAILIIALAIYFIYTYTSKK